MAEKKAWRIERCLSNAPACPWHLPPPHTFHWQSESKCAFKTLCPLAVWETSATRWNQIRVFRGCLRMCVCTFLCASSLSLVLLSPDPWTIAHQALLFKGFSRKEYWSGLPFPFPGDLPNPGMEPESLVSFTGRWILYPCCLPGSPCMRTWMYVCIQTYKHIYTCSEIYTHICFRILCPEA